jgi:mRNA interferase RelE/StbE
MKVGFDKSFSKSLDKLKNEQVKKRIISLIEKCEAAEKLTDISNLKKMTSFTNFYRIKLGDYRIGLEYEDDTLIFIVVAHRKDIYDIFP